MNTTLKSPELVTCLNSALEKEHAIYVQYLSHAKTLKGVEARPVNRRLRRLAGFHRRHQKKLRHLIADYLEGIPSMNMGATHAADTLETILQTNMTCEESAIDNYMKILALLDRQKEDLPYEYCKIDYALKKIIRNDQSHIATLKKLRGS